MSGPATLDEEPRQSNQPTLSRIARLNYDRLLSDIAPKYRAEFVNFAKEHNLNARDCTELVKIVKDIFATCRSGTAYPTMDRLVILLQNTNLTMDTLLDITNIVRGTDARKMSGAFDALNTLITYNTTTPEILAKFTTVVNFIIHDPKLDGATDVAFDALNHITKSSSLSPDVLTKFAVIMMNIVRNNSDITINSALDSFFFVSKSPNVNYDVLVAVELISENAQGYAMSRSFDALDSFIETQNFTSQELNEFSREIVKIIMQMIDKLHPPISPAFGSLNHLIENSTFDPLLFSTMLYIARNTGEYTMAPAFDALTSLIQNPKFDSTMLESFQGPLVLIIGYLTYNPDENQIVRGFEEFDNLLKTIDLNSKRVETRNIIALTNYLLDEMDNYFPKGTFGVFDRFIRNPTLRSNNSELYWRGVALVKELGLNDDFQTCLNFAYALATFGEEKTRILYQQRGIVYFARYPKSVIDETYATLDPSYQHDKPLLLITFNKDDWNGAFYTVGRQLAKLTKGYRVVVTEVDGEDAFYNTLSAISTSHGGVDTLIIGGHGEPNAICLGGDSEKQMLDLTDEQELANYVSCFVQNPTIILESCSTGKGNSSIGDLISRILNATLFAPESPFSHSKYILDAHNIIKKVKYGVPSIKFENGTEITE